MVSAALLTLLSRLERAIGHQAAKSEFQWMQQTLQNPPPAIPPSATTLEEMVNRRTSGEPLQYILGSQPFGPLNLAVRPPVLIPRPETEDWTIRLASLLSPTPARPFKVLDLCTGSGCIPLLLCHLWSPGSTHATGVDISSTAIRLAADNAALCGVPTSSADQRADQNTFTPFSADITHRNFARDVRLAPPYHVITANPPYIPRAEYVRLPMSVRGFEDIRALLGETAIREESGSVGVPAADRAKGLGFYHRIAELVGEYGLLHRDGGTLALEVGDGQAEDVVHIIESRTHLTKVSVWEDPWGIPRVVVASA